MLYNMLGISSIGTPHGTTLPILCGFFSAKIIPPCHLGDTRSHDQTEPEAMYFSRESSVNTRKAVEDTFAMFDRDTHTIIAHEHFQHLLRNVSPVGMNK
jgi:hypothetical protein